MQMRTLNDYQEAAYATAVYPDNFRVIYPALGLASEAGEVAGKLKKILRDTDGVMDPVQKQALLDELGDVLWYVAVLAEDLGCSLALLAQRNIDKLDGRKARGTLHGSGDAR